LEQRINAYLDRIFRWSFLTKAERNRLREEMADHLYALVDDFEGKGCSEEEALAQAMTRFGTERDLRKALTKETYGWTGGTIVTVSAILAGLFLFSVICTLVRAEHVLLHFILLSPSLLLTLLLLTLGLTATRKTADRIGLLLSPLPFAAYLLQHLTLLFSLFSGASETSIIEFKNTVYPYFTERVYSALYATDIGGKPFMIGVAGFAVFGILLYLYCHNRRIAILPLLLSVGYTGWVIAAQSLNYALVKTFHGQPSQAFVDFYQYGFHVWTGQLDGLAVRLALAAVLWAVLRMADLNRRSRRLKQI
jgi:hypothetical protein